MIEVVVGVIINADNQVLITKRKAQAFQGGLWEFPGGKVEQGETPFEALKRELQEEVGIDIQAMTRLCSLQHDYPECAVRLDTYCITDYIGEPVPLEQQPMRWVAKSELADYDFPEANWPILKMIQDDIRL